MWRTTQYKKRLENEDKVYEKTSVNFTASDPETKTLELSPSSGKTWLLSKIKAWTDEDPSDNTNVGSKTDIDLYINGTSKKIARSYATDQVHAGFRTCGISLDCQSHFGQRLKITTTTNGVYISASKTGTGTHTLYLEVEGTEI